MAGSPRDVVPTADVRSAIAGDAAELARLSAQLGYPADGAVFAQRLAWLLPSPRHAVLVMPTRDDDGLRGFVACEQRMALEVGERVEIVALVVDDRIRRGGVGRQLVRAAEAWAQSRGLHEVFLSSNVTRAESHPFYEDIGYVRSKTQHAYRKSL